MSDAKRLEKLYGRVRQSTWDSANGWYVGEVDLDEFKALAVRLLEERDTWRARCMAVRDIYGLVSDDTDDQLTAASTEIKRLREGIDLLFHFVPAWAEDVPDGLDPTLYGTGTAEGDRRVKAKVDGLRDLLKPEGNDHAQGNI